MWEQVKRAMVEHTKEVCGSVRVEANNTNSLWWNDEVKTATRKKEGAWKEKDVWKLKEKIREKLKGVYIRSKRK